MSAEIKESNKAMSFLAGRLAATEGAYFLHESKQAVGRLVPKLPPATKSPEPIVKDDAADVLPEILRHSIPLRAISPPEDPSFSTASKWLLQNNNSPASPSSPDSLNPLRAYVSLPQATFGPKRWQLPNEQPTVSASTANALRQDGYSQMDSKKLQALAVGYSQIGAAFAIATTVVFGGGVAVFVYTAHKLQMESTDDIRTKGKDLIQPGADILKEQMVPLRAWAENMSRKWRFEGGGEAKEKSIVKELSKILGPRTSD